MSPSADRHLYRLYPMVLMGVFIALLLSVPNPAEAQSQNITSTSTNSTVTITETVTVTVNPAEAEGSLLVPVLNWIYDRILDLAELIINAPDSPWILFVLSSGAAIIFFLSFLKVR